MFQERGNDGTGRRGRRKPQRSWDPPGAAWGGGSASSRRGTSGLTPPGARPHACFGCPRGFDNAWIAPGCCGERKTSPRLGDPLRSPISRGGSWGRRPSRLPTPSPGQPSGLGLPFIAAGGKSPRVPTKLIWDRGRTAPSPAPHPTPPRLADPGNPARELSPQTFAAAAAQNGICRPLPGPPRNLTAVIIIFLSLR